LYVTYCTYTAMGYSAVPKAEFARWSAMAEQTVRKYTFDRITDKDITRTNQRGVCEIIDLLYKDAQPGSQPVVSFSNSKYSETYAAPPTLDERVRSFMGIYFTADQLWRGF